ncbi:MAG: M14 family metallocarboxypeptidase [Gammaproteobacteria bacterium]|nr:M14 family metallocarboxypeptidase [Gammaproteobacteria bacterium]
MSQYTIEVGKPWDQSQKQQWLENQSVKRSYQKDVLEPLSSIKQHFTAHHYGVLPYEPERYPLWALTTKNWQADAQTVLITGGVHGYETSGVLGALAFAKSHAREYESKFNFIIAPCISPWGYETINRWNPAADDPNRSFAGSGSTPESSQLIAFLRALEVSIDIHFDLHETTDTDNTEFRPAKAARDGVAYEAWQIPDGFYTVTDTSRNQLAFQQAIIDSVKQVTHIAPADEQGRLIGVPILSEGVIEYDKKSLGLCGGLTSGVYTTTTEVYPDSPKVDAENCTAAQVAAICGGLNYLLAK